jgi:hypothetical protein
VADDENAPAPARRRALLAGALADGGPASRAVSADVAATGAARRDLAAGHVDARLLTTLAALATRHHLRILAFGDAEPGGGARLRVRSAELAIRGGRPDPAARLRSVIAALRAPRLPLLAARTRVTRAGAAALLQIGFLAPTPLGLLRMRAPA